LGKSPIFHIKIDIKPIGEKPQQLTTIVHTLDRDIGLPAANYYVTLCAQWKTFRMLNDFLRQIYVDVGPIIVSWSLFFYVDD